jgi:hypothetical protein
MKAMFRSCFLWILSCAACSEARSPDATESAAMAPELQAFVLVADPGEAKAVAAAKEAGPQDHVVVQGRIASVVPRFAVFTLMDQSLPYCGETNKEDDCKTPWDYCCEPRDTRTRLSLLVELRGVDGNPLQASGLPGLRLLDLVKVRGQLGKDEHRNLVLIADGVFRVERPEMPDHVGLPR